MIKSNIFSGLTVGIIALPLSMALAIATGVPPQLGLYTAIVAGILAAIFGSSKVNISGPSSEKHTIEAESAKLIAGATKNSDSNASKGITVSLTKSGDGILFSKLKEKKKV